MLARGAPGAPATRLPAPGARTSPPCRGACGTARPARAPRWWSHGRRHRRRHRADRRAQGRRSSRDAVPCGSARRCRGAAPVARGAMRSCAWRVRVPRRAIRPWCVSSLVVSESGSVGPRMARGHVLRLKTMYGVSTSVPARRTLVPATGGAELADVAVDRLQVVVGHVAQVERRYRRTHRCVPARATALRSSARSRGAGWPGTSYPRAPGSRRHFSSATAPRGACPPPRDSRRCGSRCSRNPGSGSGHAPPPSERHCRRASRRWQQPPGRVRRDHGTEQIGAVEGRVVGHLVAGVSGGEAGEQQAAAIVVACD